MTESYSRRKVLAATGVATVTALAGCGGDGDDGDEPEGNTVLAGPNNEFVFEPEELTISAGETVTWEFRSPNHNVCAYPEMHNRVDIPSDADGFGSMEAGGDKFATMEEGDTYEHTFESTGEFTYVCVPHAASDMIGTVVVE
jgi:plastocyanin